MVNGVYWFKNPNTYGFQTGGITDGLPVQENTYIGYPNQQWEVTYLGSGKYSIINHYSGKAIDIPSSNPASPPTTQNLQLQQWDFNFTNNQLWNIGDVYYGNYWITNPTNNLSVTLLNGSTTQFTPIVQATTEGNANDVWEPIQITTLDSATVNFGSTTGTMAHVAAGTLQGFYAVGSSIKPPDSLFLPLRLNTVRESEDNYPNGYQSTSFPIVADTLAKNNIKQEIVISDNWGYSGTPPGQNGNWAAWDTTVMNVVNAANTAVPGGVANGTFSFDIWNEPDGPYFWSSSWPAYNSAAGFYGAWLHAYKKIRTSFPTAIIAGPSYQNFNASNLEAFLSYCKTNNCVPNYVTWHFSADGNGPAADAATLQAYINANITGVSGLQLNEYLNQTQQDYAGITAWYVAQLERGKFNAAMHAIWGADGIIDSLITNNSGGYQKRASWWVYKAYGDIKGSILTTTPGTASPANAELIAGHNSSPNTVNMLVGMGNASGSGLSHTAASGNTIQVKCINVSSIFPGRTTLQLTLQDIPNSSGGTVTAEQLIYTENVPVVNNTAYIYISCDNNQQDAYEITIQ